LTISMRESRFSPLTTPSDSIIGKGRNFTAKYECFCGRFFCHWLASSRQTSHCLGPITLLGCHGPYQAKQVGRQHGSQTFADCA
jgi:hypothetical protein